MKIWILDNGSIVIEHTQLMWNVPGEQVRIPVYSVLIAHTVGHYSLLVTGEQGATPLLFAFDVTYTPAALEREIQAGFHNDPVAGVRSIRHVKALAHEHGAKIFFSHDMEEWRTYKHAPDFYEV